MMEKNKTFARSAISYEMRNHEYGINWEGDYDVCSCFGQIDFDENASGADYMKKLGFSDKVIAIYNTLARKFYTCC